MLGLMGVIMLILVVAGPAAMTGHPVLIAIGVALGAAVLFVTRRGRRTSSPASHH